MLTNIHIENFKCFEKADIELRPLTILTGTNSSGKSTVLQAMLATIHKTTELNYLTKYDDDIYNTDERIIYKNNELGKVIISLGLLKLDNLTNRHLKKKEITINLSDGYNLDINKKFSITCSSPNSLYIYENDFYYLSADRIGVEKLSSLNHNLKIGHLGQYAIGTFERLKDTAINPALIFDEQSDSFTLKNQIAFWLSRITGTGIEAQTERVTSDTVKSFFILPDLGELSPDQVGTGNSYLFKMLIMCLLAKPDDLLLIENPEIHLHPKAQSHLGEFLSFIASRGVQLIIETHCEHLINRVRYEIYEDNLKSDNVVIHYKPSAREDFQKILINQNGHYANNVQEEIDFPEGYFDATLDQLLSIS